MKEKKRYLKELKIISIFIISMFIFIPIVYIPITAAYERPLFDDGLVDTWHPGALCIPCHYSLATKEKAQEISYGCNKCHDYLPKGVTQRVSKIDMTKISDIHKDIICIRCHIGTKNQKDIADFHRIMPIECSNCHEFKNNTYQIPEKKNCSDCHMKGDPHMVHGNKIGKICIACHGELFAKKYINKTMEVTDKGIVIMPEVVREYPTIVQFINKIFQLITIR